LNADGKELAEDALPPPPPAWNTSDNEMVVPLMVMMEVK
jgi:hypothetical protein